MVINGVQTPWPQASTQFYNLSNPPGYAVQFQQPYQSALQPMFGPNQSFSQVMPPHAGYAPPYNAVPAVGLYLNDSLIGPYLLSYP